MIVESITDTEETDSICIEGDGSFHARAVESIPTTYLPAGSSQTEEK